MFIFAGNIFAHQADVSTTLLSQQTNGQWILQIKASLSAFKQEVTTSYPEETYQSPEEFQDLVIRHVMENISIVFDKNTEVKFQQPLVRLGHETNVIFEVVGVPENFERVFFKNSSFKDIHKNQSGLVILKEGFSQKQFVLNNTNEHTAELVVDGKQFVPLKPTSKIAMVMPNILLGLALLGVVGWFLFLTNKFRVVES